MGRLFDEVRARVSAEDAARRYGLAVSPQGKALCPWHPDTHPSLSFDRRTGRCKCFTCHAGGSSIDITAILLHMTPYDAALTLDNHFGLHIEDGPAPSSEAIEARKEAAELKKAAREQENSWISFLLDVFREAENLLNCGLNPENPHEALATEISAFIKGRAADKLIEMGQGRLIGYEG